MFVKILVAMVPVIFWGCGGAAEKWVDVVNEPSGLQISARYVTSTKSVKIYQRRDPSRKIKMSFLMSDAIPRVSATRLSIHLKSFDFGVLLKSYRNDWLSLLGEPGDGCTDISREVGDNKFAQSKTGVIKITVPGIETALAYVQLDPEEFPKCLKAFAQDEKLFHFTKTLLQFRDDLMGVLAKETGFDGQRAGKRLSRKPSAIEFDENTTLNVDEENSG